jgi:hypothetical protein
MCLGAAAATAADRDTAADSSSPSWFSRWFGWGAKPEEPKPAPARQKAAAPKAVKPPTLVDTAAAERAREQETLLRRLEVCDRLMQIAVDLKDEDLERQIEQLEERARTAYAQRTAYLPAGGAQLELDAQILEKHLGATAGPDQPSEASTSTANGGNAFSRTAAEGVKP